MPNGSFEEYSECPTLNELNNGQFERAIGWFRPTLGTPDYYHRCNNNGNGIVGVPNNFWGYQEPFEGEGFVGFGAAEWNNQGEIIGNEYMRRELFSNLKPCFEYQFSMYVSLCDFSTYAVGKIGALFTKENLFIPSDVYIGYSPQILNLGSPIVDSANWINVKGCFVANGLEKFLTIGYFNETPNNDTLRIQEGPFLGAYYYVDSVSLHEIGPVSDEICDSGEISFPNIITPNNDNRNDAIDATPYFAITDEIVILNRWGNVVTILTEENPIWDGTNRDGKACSEGNYFYTFTYQWGTQTKEKSGCIQLVR